MMKRFVFCCALLLTIVGCTSTKEKWEIVIHSRGGHTENSRLVLEDVDQHIIAFTVGTPRMVASKSLQYIVSEWDSLFTSSEPNAVLSVRTAQKEHHEQMVILKKPQLSDHQLTFTIEQKMGHIEGQFTDAVLFVDATGFFCSPWHVTPKGSRTRWCGKK